MLYIYLSHNKNIPVLLQMVAINLQSERTAFNNLSPFESSTKKQAEHLSNFFALNTFFSKKNIWIFF